MFQTARMRKLKIVTLSQYSDLIVRSLHEKGNVQINDVSERIQQDSEWAELLKPSKATPLTSHLSSLLMRTSGIFDLFTNALAEDQGIKGLIKSFVNPDVPEKKEVEDLDSESLIKKAENLLDELEPNIKAVESQLNILNSKKSELESNKDLANVLKKFDFDLALLNDSKYTSTIVGRIDVESAEEFKKKSAKITDELVILETLDDDKINKIIIVITLTKFKEEVYTLLRTFDFDKFEVDGLNGKPSEIISDADSQLKAIDNDESKLSDELKAIAKKSDNDIALLKEQLEIEKERNEVFANFGETDKSVLLEAWIPLKEVDKAKNLVESSTEGHCVVEIEDIGEDDSEVPVLQENPSIVKPYEFLVGMYSSVKYNEIDPTLLVFLVFPFLFGYCLTDAFYGIILVIMGIVMYKGIGKVNETMGSFGSIIIACGLWTIVLGFITNGFLGDFSSRFLGIALPTVVPAFDAFVHPENILIVALAVGIIYTNVGFIIGIINNFRYGEKKEALGSQIVWLILEAGAVLLVLGMMVSAIGTIGIVIGAALLILSILILLYTGGIYGIMDIFSYMGNILSYARLLALCLATGGIAMTVNILTGMLYDMVPYVGIIIAIIIFIGGHIVNFLFQVLGAFINALRLHYVEFFSQFFMGGTHKFESFSANRVLTKIKRT
ncbi:V-type ATP synthase subunit I [Methanobrevibacter filiformis]|uniref:A-type ATP synthase subunit I n=1 Tax=Methanobrevibacter filiformis TaxID=55758 RepID=A0A166CWQ7_9EURY|nr:V-type ATP synthase subunit I [Methanobrevibacter filiformis]KZX14945.1 V-type ATP synthase subunit I [Methanobrevibacter filiformis]